MFRASFPSFSGRDQKIRSRVNTGPGKVATLIIPLGEGFGFLSPQSPLSPWLRTHYVPSSMAGRALGPFRRSRVRVVYLRGSTSALRIFFQSHYEASEPLSRRCPCISVFRILLTPGLVILIRFLPLDPCKSSCVRPADDHQQESPRVPPVPHYIFKLFPQDHTCSACVLSRPVTPSFCNAVESRHLE